LCIKAQNGKVFVGECWSGNSVWLDYINPKAREFWSSLYSLERYKETTKDVFIWNDMNEPAVFKSFETVMPKNTL